MKGFYVPGSAGATYVANKQNEQGSYVYDKAAIELGIDKQKALQELSKNYDQVINNAYASYLAGAKGIETSAMGEGYKNAYNQMLDQALLTETAEANMSAQNVRAQLEQQETTARTSLNKQFETEALRLDRVAESMNNYFEYLKTLSDVAGNDYLSNEQKEQEAKDMYDFLYRAQPRSYNDNSGEAGLSYAEWVKANLKDTTADQEFSNWLFFQGGWDEFKNYLNAYNRTETLRAARDTQIKAEEQKIAEERRRIEEQKAAEEKQVRDAKIREQRINDKNYQGYVASSIDGIDYKRTFAVQINSPKSKEISNALNIEAKIKSGELKVGDIIKYKGDYYRIDSNRGKSAGSTSYTQYR